MLLSTPCHHRLADRGQGEEEAAEAGQEEEQESGGDEWVESHPHPPEMDNISQDGKVSCDIDGIAVNCNLVHLDK